MSPLLSNAQSFQHQLHRHSRQSSTCSGNDTLSASSSSTSSSSSPFPALLKAFNPQEVQVEVECEPAAIGDRVLLRSIIIHNMSKLDLDDSLTLTAEPNDLCFLERVLVGSLARGQRKVVSLQLRVRSSLAMPYEDAIPERYVLTLSHASPSSLPPSSASSPPPDLEIRYSFENSFRYFLKGLPGLAPRRVVSLPCPSPPSRPPSSPLPDAASRALQPRAGGSCRRGEVPPCSPTSSRSSASVSTSIWAGCGPAPPPRTGPWSSAPTPCTRPSRRSPCGTPVASHPAPTRARSSPIFWRATTGAAVGPGGAGRGEGGGGAGRGGATRALREQQACVVVLPEGILQSAVELDQLRRQLELVQRAGLNPLVLLTHVDLAYPSLRADPSGRGVGELGEARREAAPAAGGGGEPRPAHGALQGRGDQVRAAFIRRVVPVLPAHVLINRPVTALARASGPPSGSCLAHDDPLTSTHTPRRRFSIDRLVYKVLAKALQLAAEYVESHPEGAREEGPGQEAVPLRSLFGVSHAWPAFLEAEDSAPDALRAEPERGGSRAGSEAPRWPRRAGRRLWAGWQGGAWWGRGGRAGRAGGEGGMRTVRRWWRGLRRGRGVRGERRTGRRTERGGGGEAGGRRGRGGGGDVLDAWFVDDKRGDHARAVHAGGGL